jgi:hypothetical protein
MKCWATNKHNPANKGKKINFNDYEYGSFKDAVGTMAATAAIAKNAKKNKEKAEQTDDGNKEKD